MSGCLAVPINPDKWNSAVVINCRKQPHRAKVKLKVKESRNRPGVAQRVPGGLGSQITMTFSK